MYDSSERSLNQDLSQICRRAKLPKQRSVIGGHGYLKCPLSARFPFARLARKAADETEAAARRNRRRRRVGVGQKDHHAGPAERPLTDVDRAFSGDGDPADDVEPEPGRALAAQPALERFVRIGDARPAVLDAYRDIAVVAPRDG